MTKPLRPPGRSARRLTRREWLLATGGAAAAIAIDVLIPRPEPEVQAPRFPGDPGQGRLYYGATIPWDRDLREWERELRRPLTVHRTYFGPEEVRELVSRARADHRHHRLPLVSVKCPGTWAALAEGRHDRWLQELLRGLARTALPVFLALHHEPENDTGPVGMHAVDWVAMQTRAIELARELAPDVTIVPVLMQWTFDRQSGRRPDDWLVPAADVLGIDVYNDWSATNGIAWRSFETRMEMVEPWTGGRPVVVAEYGTRAPEEDPERGARWLHDAFSYAVSHDIVCLAYYNSYLNSPDGTWELDGARERAFAELLAHPRVERL